jgi:hypothetical protein
MAFLFFFFDKANFATNSKFIYISYLFFFNNNDNIDESQVSLMSQPYLLQYICNVPAVFTSHIEIHKHVVRCLANLSLYGKLLL